MQGLTPRQSGNRLFFGVDESGQAEPIQATIIQLGGTVHGAKGRGYLNYLPLGGGTPGQALNLGRVQERPGVPVWIGFFQNRPVITSLDFSRMEPNGFQGYRSPLFAQHAPDHRWSSGDPVYVDSRQIEDLMVRPAGLLKVKINPGHYDNGLTYAYYAGQSSLDLASHQPAAGTKRGVGLYLDSAGALQAAAGAIVARTAVLPEPNWPAGAFRLALVIVFGDKNFVDFEYIKQRKALYGNPARKVSQLYTPAGTLAWSVDSSGNLDNDLGGVMTAPAAESVFKIKNTSGATAAAGNLGYINEAGEYKTTTTAADVRAWAVVVIGGANNADIYVATRGRFPVTYTGAAPTAGQFLTTSTVAGAALATSSLSPAIMALALAAGSGGLVEALLLPSRPDIPRTDTHYFYGVTAASDSDFVSTIATLPGGATLTYGAVSSGAANAIVPWAALDAAFNGKIVLHNTTRGTSALISAVVTGTSTITLTANVPAGWQTGDTITARSQTNTANWNGGAYYFDLDFSGMTTRPPLGVAAIFHLGVFDTGAGEAIAAFHPFEANSASKSFQQRTSTASRTNLTTLTIPNNQNKICIGWDATGSGTCRVFMQHVGWTEAQP
jgi:hypothetical protein